MDLLVLAVLAAIIVVVVMAVQRKQPRTLFTTPGDRQDGSDVGAVQQWVALRNYALAHGLRLLYVQRVYKRQPNGCRAQVSIYGDRGSTLRVDWFWRTQVAPGLVVSVNVGEGWGPHTRCGDVLFIGSQDRPECCQAQRRHRALSAAPAPSTNHHWQHLSTSTSSTIPFANLPTAQRLSAPSC